MDDTVLSIPVSTNRTEYNQTGFSQFPLQILRLLRDMRDKIFRNR